MTLIYEVPPPQNVIYPLMQKVLPYYKPLNIMKGIIQKSIKPLLLENEMSVLKYEECYPYGR